MQKITKEKILHDLFTAGIIIKFIDGVFELVGGLALIFVRSDSIAKVVQTIFQHELAQDPTDAIANFLIQASQSISAGALSFASIYLIIHGTIKIGIFWGLWSKKLWTYPLAGAILFLFIAYQLARIFSTHSVVLSLLTSLDIIILILLRFEYKRTISSKNNAP
jgi:uncharacterized membrane protein